MLQGVCCVNGNNIVVVDQGIARIVEKRGAKGKVIACKVRKNFLDRSRAH